MPMIPLGLKETKEINFMEPFSDFILEHYSEEPSIYMDAIADMTDTRQVSSIERDIYIHIYILLSILIDILLNRLRRHPHATHWEWRCYSVTTIYCIMWNDASFHPIAIWASISSGTTR